MSVFSPHPDQRLDEERDGQRNVNAYGGQRRNKGHNDCQSSRDQVRPSLTVGTIHSGVVDVIHHEMAVARAWCMRAVITADSMNRFAPYTATATDASSMHVRDHEMSRKGQQGNEEQQDEIQPERHDSPLRMFRVRPAWEIQIPPMNAKLMR